MSKDDTLEQTNIESTQAKENGVEKTTQTKDKEQV